MKKIVTVEIPAWFVRKNPAISGRTVGSTVVASGRIIKETDKAILFENEIFTAWLPKSIIEVRDGRI